MLISLYGDKSWKYHRTFKQIGELFLVKGVMFFPPLNRSSPSAHICDALDSQERISVVVASH